MKRLWLLVFGLIILSGCYQVVDAGDIAIEENEEPTQEEKDAIVADFLGTFDDIECDDEHDHSDFTAADAVSIVLAKYGSDDDLTYLYEPEAVHYGGGIGYYVAIKSKMIEAEGGDGIMITLFVSEEGEVYETH